MDGLTSEQQRTVSDFLANIGVAWFAGGIVAPFFVTRSFPEILISGIWGLFFTGISLWFSLWIFRTIK